MNGDYNQTPMSELDLSKVSKFGQTFISYGSYHYNIVNKWIHIFCVPIIAATLICALSFIPFSLTIMGYTIGVAELSVALILFYYLTINVGFAIGMGVLMFGLHFLWQKGFQHVPEENFLTWVLVIHIVAWILQFVGHGVFEKRKPALLDNLSQVLNAPLFVVVEIFEMIGLKSSEMAVWNEQIRKNVEALRAKNKER